MVQIEDQPATDPRRNPIRMTIGDGDGNSMSSV